MRKLEKCCFVCVELPHLVTVEGYAQHGHRIVHTLLRAEQAAVRDENLHVAMRQYVRLGQPFAYHHIRRQLANRFVLEFP